MRAYAAVVIVLAACGGGNSVYGVYEVTSHTSNATGCDDVTPVAEPPYFSFDYFATNPEGFYLYAVRGCTGMDAATCEDVIGIVAEAPVGWFAFTTDATWVGNTCKLDYAGYAASAEGDTFQLRIEKHEGTIATTACTTDEANRMRDTLPCVAAETVIGTRL